MTLPDYVQRWLDNPDGGGRFTRQRDAVLAHDPACSSLTEVWLPKKSGVSCPSDLSDCDGDGCDATFFNEGLGLYEDADGYDVPLCACCARKRGLS